MRLIFTLIVLCGFGWVGWYVWENCPQARYFVESTLLKPEAQTLEAKCKTEGPRGELFYYPYLLMEVKYLKDQATTCEGSLLWDLHDGEMVVDVATFEKTHGFEDCLLTKANQYDFKILKALVENEGVADRETLYACFSENREAVKGWVESCVKKNLIVFSGNTYRLHFENPRFELVLSNETFSKKITFPLSEYEDKNQTLRAFFTQALQLVPTFETKPIKKGMRLKKCYTSSQVEQLAQLAFGEDFAIRKTQELYLPIYRTTRIDGESSAKTVYINALNGKQLSWESP